MLVLLGIGVYLSTSASSALAAVPDLSGMTRLTKAAALSYVVAAIEAEDLASLEHDADADCHIMIGPPSGPVVDAPSCGYPVRSAGTHPCRHRPAASRASDDSPG